MDKLVHKREELLARIGQWGSCAVAFSGGVDSAVVAKAAQLALGDRALAVTARSASVAQGEVEMACQVAQQIGIAHRVIETREFENPRYLQNAPDRCYHCKSELYDRLYQVIQPLGYAAILNGANADDLGDYRPGMQAAAERQVHSPLAECGITKDEVRQLARDWQLPVWNKPASPCLSSRVVYGEAVTPERLARVDQAEQFLRQQGFPTVRVRYHAGDLARLEVPAEQIERLCQAGMRQELAARLQELGFKFVTIDLLGFRSGSLNSLIPVDTLLQGTASNRSATAKESASSPPPPAAGEEV